MQYTERLPYVPSPRTLAVPLVALVLGAGAATGLYTLVDNDGTSVTPGDTRVIVADPPAQPGEGVAAKNEAGVASAIGNPALPGEGVSAKDEAGVASAIGRPEQPQTLSKDEAGVGALMGPPNASSSTETKDEAATAAVIANSGTSRVPSQGRGGHGRGHRPVEGQHHADAGRGQPDRPPRSRRGPSVRTRAQRGAARPPPPPVAALAASGDRRWRPAPF